MLRLARQLAAAAGLLITTGTPAAVAAAESFFPLMAWNRVPPDAAILARMRECGLTVAGFVPPGALDLCQAAGLKAIVRDPRVTDYDWRRVDETAARRSVASLAVETAHHPAVLGYFLRDEPGADLFPGLAKVAALVRELAPGRAPFINLFPNYAAPAQLGTVSYEEYLEQFATLCQPAWLSFDHYALMEDGTLRSGYWRNLEQMRAAAKRLGVDFWNVVLATAHFDFREPTAADLRFQVYSTLAYGGRGIAYFTYFAPRIGNYRAAPIDQFGHPTPTWSHLQNVNLQVAKLAPTFLQLASDDVYHLGPIPAGAHGPRAESLLVGPVKGEFLVGEFTHADGTRYVMVVNKDPARSRPYTPHFRTPPRELQMVSPYSGELVSFAGEQQWLAPGQGVLLKPGW